jgi:cation-transporting P-type ATPase F
MDYDVNKAWHSLDSSEVVRLLESDSQKGISAEKAQERLQQFGPNVLSAKKGKGPLVRFLLQFHQPLVYILIAAVVVTGFLGEWVDAGVIFTVVFINGVVGFLQESKALRALDALAKAMRASARVVRGGNTREINADHLVPGDIVLLRSGEKVPADIRLIHAHELRVDESALTGESVPVEKKLDVLKDNVVLADKKNMAFASTLVTYGQCRGIVIGTGNQTEIGQISKLISETEELVTPLSRKINHFSKVLLYIIIALATVTFFAGLYRGHPVADTFMAAVALAVAAIPEGLPAAFTIILAIGVSRMAKRNAIIRKLPAVETLGSTTVVCSDKTGTLTVNKMTVQEIVAGDERFKVDGVGYQPHGQFLASAGNTIAPVSESLRQCLLAGLLCNDSELVEEAGVWNVEGDPTEGALIVAARKAGLSEKQEHARLPRIDSLPFESEYQYMATMHRTNEGSPHLIYVKGSVEAVLARCDTMLDSQGAPIPCNAERIIEDVHSMARDGMRVLAFARLEIGNDVTDLTHNHISQGLTFLGIQGMIDPPRQAAIDAIQACHRAGVKVKMITGDHAVTAAAIARQMNLDGSGSNQLPEALTGKEIVALSDQELSDRIDDVTVFARVTPEQKLKLVRALQNRGQVIAMTGDGVNDAPALRQADIGVAMGLGGTEVAKEAADMVLTDDNFATIKAAIEEGRCVFDNLTKFIVWTLPTNMGEGLVVLWAVLAGLTLPILPIHILWVNMSTALLLGLMLAFERTEHHIMQRPPRDPKVPIFTPALGLRIVIVATLMTVAAFILFRWELDLSGNVDVARTVAVNVVVFVELFYLFNCRSLNQSFLSLGFFSNRLLLGGVSGMIAFQLLFTYLPLANRLFNTAPVSLHAWFSILIVGVLVSLIVGG